MTTENDGRREPPPLRLVHLLLYVAVCSVFLFAETSPRFARAPRDLREAADWRYRQIIRLPDALLDSANVTVLVLLAAWTFAGRRVWNEPGHLLVLWWVWGHVSPACESQWMSVAEWLAGVRTSQEFIQFWNWAKAIHLLRSLPVACLFLGVALGWRRIANTWPWKIYFACAAVWILFAASAEYLPFNWSEVVRSSTPPLIARFVSGRWWQLVLVLLLLSMLNDLLPGRPRRHWSHWICASHPLFMHVFRYIPPYVWDYLHGT